MSDSSVTVYTHTHALTQSLSPVLAFMMKSKELKTSRSILMLILRFSRDLAHCLVLARRDQIRRHSDDQAAELAVATASLKECIGNFECHLAAVQKCLFSRV